jgi:hypothetical protein
VNGIVSLVYIDMLWICTGASCAFVVVVALCMSILSTIVSLAVNEASAMTLKYFKEVAIDFKLELKLQLVCRS